MVSPIPLSVLLLSASLIGLCDPAGRRAGGSRLRQQAAAPSPDDIKQREQELEAAREQQKKAAELQAKLKADIAAIGQDRSKLNAQLIDIAAQVRGVETRIGDAEARLRPLDGREQQIRASLDFAPLRNRRGAGSAAARRAAHAAGAAGPPRRRAAIAAHRHAARIGRA